MELLSLSLSRNYDIDEFMLRYERTRFFFLFLNYPLLSRFMRDYARSSNEKSKDVINLGNEPLSSIFNILELIVWK